MPNFWKRLALATLIPATMLVAVPIRAGVGDLLVAPTRIILDGGRGTQVLLNNIGDEEATYRVSAELRRMRPDGSLVDVEDADATVAELAARDMVVFAPRRVTLPPYQPQAIRISARAPEGLPDGEYRIHLLFRAIPKPRAAEDRQQAEGISFSLTPVYGVTIPVIVRLGRLQVQAAIANVRVAENSGKRAIAVDLTRQGDRSTFGEINVLRAGEEEPIAKVRGIALYTEVNARTVMVPVREDYQGPLSGPVTVEYRASQEEGGDVIAAAQTTLN